ncbi:hypothetical protein VIBNISFn118_1920002 [Vibrio nigripulchritudo SFn118]|nr:hypothetical protein VIBNISFn118_1920002 [Vibrio nigripulchritudo SFn118]
MVSVNTLTTYKSVVENLSIGTDPFLSRVKFSPKPGALLTQVAIPLKRASQ